MSNESLPPGRTRGIRDARCVLFAYHEAGYACMAELLAMNAPIAALFTHHDHPGEEIWWRSCAELAAAHAIPTFTPEKMGPTELALIRGLEPAILYSFYYRTLLPEVLLQTAVLGAYNLHGSLLPKYRGRAPVNWMIANGETEGGVTLHHMVARADAGAIVAQRAVAISATDTALSLYRKIVPLGAALIREYHPLIVAGIAPQHPQDLSAASYYGRRSPEDGKLDWYWPADRICNLVRAVTHPYPGAFCLVQGRQLFIWEARVGAPSGELGPPGVIIGADEHGALEVAAGRGSVLIVRAQMENDVERSAADALAALADQRSIRLS